MASDAVAGLAEEIRWRESCIALSAHLAERNPEFKPENYENIDHWLDEINALRKGAPLNGL